MCCDNVWVRYMFIYMLVSDITRGKEDTSGGDELAVKNSGEVQKRQDTKRGYQKGAGTKDYIDRQIRKEG